MNAEQLNQLKDIGTHLRQKRQEQSKTLEEIATKTFIPLRLLEALEAGQEQPLPEPIFIQGFIRRYGDVLGLSGQELAEQFSPNASPIITQTALTEESPSTPEPSNVETLFSDSPPLVLKHQSVYFAYLFLGLIAVAGLSFGVNQRQPSPQMTQTPVKETEVSRQPSEESVSVPVERSVEETQPPIESTPLSNTKVVSAVSPTLDTTQSEEAITPEETEAQSTATERENGTVTVDMKLTGESWVKVMIDGKTEFEGILSEGTQKSWTATKAVNIIAGNAGAVLLSFNQEDEKPMGLPGAVERITLNSEDS